MKKNGPWAPPEETKPASRRSAARPSSSFRPRTGGRKVAGSVALASLAILAIAFGSLAGLMLVYSINLPQIQDLERYQPITTTVLYDIHGRQFGSFALQRRIDVTYNDFSPLLRQAVISIEDKNFESHWGINLFRVVGAAYHDLRSKGRAQGASTLTMQLARNLFLSDERTVAPQAAGDIPLLCRLNMLLPSSRSSRFTATRSIWGMAFMVSKRGPSTTSRSMPIISPSRKLLCLPGCRRDQPSSRPFSMLTAHFAAVIR